MVGKQKKKKRNVAEKIGTDEEDSVNVKATPAKRRRTVNVLTSTGKVEGLIQELPSVSADDVSMRTDNSGDADGEGDDPRPGCSDWKPGMTKLVKSKEMLALERQ